MRAVRVIVLMLVAAPGFAWAQMRPYAPPVQAPLPAPVIVQTPLPAPVTQTPLPAPVLTPTLTPAPAPAPEPAPYAAPVAMSPPSPPAGACKSLGECAREATQCLAAKLATREEPQNETRFFVQFDESGRPGIVRYASDIPSDEDNADANDCASDLQACLSESCQN